MISKLNLSSYAPVIAVFSTAGLMALATSLGIQGFMGFSLAMLASLKLMDIPSFVTRFAKYDLIAKRTRVYGLIYPFAELLIGLNLLAKVAPLATGIGALILGGMGVTSVVKAVWKDQQKLDCACVGGRVKVPLGVISIAENLMMVGMGMMLSLPLVG
jgi:hypothetical protein